MQVKVGGHNNMEYSTSGTSAVAFPYNLFN
jgi:hypothetical protein